MIPIRKLIPTVQLLIILAFIGVSQFYKLTSIPILIWDEARLGTSAYEMSKNGNWLVTTIHGTPDLWSTKPAMMIWAQAICIKLFGLSEFSIRFPSALCAALLILLVAYIVKRITKNGWAAVLSAIILSTSIGFIARHGSRHGEYDTMLALFICSYLICFFLYTETDDPSKKNRYLLFFFMAITCAALTKGVAALMFTPSLALYALFRNSFVPTLRKPAFYIGAAIFLFFVFGYYLLREQYNPGYLEAIKNNELGGRFSEVIEGHSGTWSYYWDMLRGWEFGVWYWILPTSLIAVFLISKTQIKRAIIYFLFTLLCFLIIISASATKIGWYIMPAYPILAIIGGLLIHAIAQIAAQFIRIIPKRMIVIALAIIFSIQPVKEFASYMRGVDYIDLSKDNFYALSYYLRDALHNEKQLPDFVYVTSEYDLQWQLYLRMLEEKGHHTSTQFLYVDNTIKPGDYVLTNRPAAEQYVTENFQYSIKETYYGTTLFSIIAPK